jgi:replicative DNA helicase
MTPPTTDPERALIGAALRGAAQALDVIHDKDLADRRLRVIAGVIRKLAEAGIPPDPTTVLAQARATGTVTRAEAVQALALLLHELVAECPLPASARFYAVAVLDEAIRRRTAEVGVRLTQAAEGESLESLLALVDREHQAVRELADRRAAAGASPPRLRAVSA